MLFCIHWLHCNAHSYSDSESALCYVLLLLLQFLSPVQYSTSSYSVVMASCIGMSTCILSFLGKPTIRYSVLSSFDKSVFTMKTMFSPIVETTLLIVGFSIQLLSMFGALFLLVLVII